MKLDGRIHDEHATINTMKLDIMKLDIMKLDIMKLDEQSMKLDESHDET
jgi:hypothetical protein